MRPPAFPSAFTHSGVSFHKFRCLGMDCRCKATRDWKLGCYDECLNWMLNIECVQGTCPCGDLCANQQM
ncbi:hypothetical protein V2J09_008919 [Rumex salicifolius]